jgi:nitroreductase
METTKAIHLRRSIRRYLPDPVDRELIKEILEDAMWAPSGVNLQPWYYVVLTSEEDMNLLKGIMAEMAGRLTPELVERFRKNPDVVKHTTGFLQTLGNAPACALVFYQTPQEPEKVTMVMSLGASAQNFCLSAADKGLGTCMIGPNFSPETMENMRQIFAPDKGPLGCLITLGYPKITPKAPRRKDGRWVIR